MDHDRFYRLLIVVLWKFWWQNPHPTNQNGALVEQVEIRGGHCAAPYLSSCCYRDGEEVCEPEFIFGSGLIWSRFLTLLYLFIDQRHTCLNKQYQTRGGLRSVRQTDPVLDDERWGRWRDLNFMEIEVVCIVSNQRLSNPNFRLLYPLSQDDYHRD